MDKIESVKVLHLESGKYHYYNFKTWLHHRAIEKRSGIKIYKLIESIPAVRSRKMPKVDGYKDVNQAQARSLSQGSPPPLPKKKKNKRCNC